MTEASGKFFSNTACEYYPCHEGIAELNCLFCYCPLYPLKDCPGNPSHKEKAGIKVKVCTACTFPHEPSNYDTVLQKVKQMYGRGAAVESVDEISAEVDNPEADS